MIRPRLVFGLLMMLFLLGGCLQSAPAPDGGEQIGAAAGPAENSVYVKPASGKVGDTISVEIAANEVRDLYGYQMDVTYDPAILEYVGMENGSFLSGGAPNSTYEVPVNTATSGMVGNIAAVKLGQVSGENGSGTLVTLTFQAKSTGTSAIQFTNVKFIGTDSGELAVETNAGSVNVE